MREPHFFFAGGGTGGHIYPGIAVAEQIIKIRPGAKIIFLCSGREIDSKVLSKTGFEFHPLPAKGMSVRPDKLIDFCISLCKSYYKAKEKLINNRPAVLLGIGGFASAPAVLAAHRLKVPIALVNVDIVPGKANKLLERFARQIFVQFEDTRKYFSGAKKVTVTGCPVRRGFESPEPGKAIRSLGLDEQKKVLLIVGGSSGAKGINDAVCTILGKLAGFAGEWQIVHIAGQSFESVQQKYENATIKHKVLDYYDEMADLLAAADLVVGRAGAVSVAEYAAAGAASICVPYPYHKDKHQYLNAEELLRAGAAIVVEDLLSGEKTGVQLAQKLQELMRDDSKRGRIARAAAARAARGAASKIADWMCQWANALESGVLD